MKPMPDPLWTALNALMPDEEQKLQWFKLPIPALGGRTPLEAINDGEFSRVLQVAQAYAETDSM